MEWTHKQDQFTTSTYLFLIACTQAILYCSSDWSKCNPLDVPQKVDLTPAI
jgi:hypothetical protein